MLLVMVISVLSPLLSIALAVRSDAQNASQAVPDTLGYRTEEVRYRNGSIRLGALLMLPESARPVAAVVIVQGSGRSDRTNQWAQAIARVVVHSGVAVLLTDKRGAGASDGDWRTSSFDDLAGDAIAGVAALRLRPEIDGTRVGLIGLSQGGAIAPLAAARSDSVAFVISVSAAAVSFAEQTYFEMANTARQAGLADEHVREVVNLNRAAAQYLTMGDWEQYAAARQRGLQSVWKGIAEGFPESRDAPIWTFLRAAADYDPLPYWMQLTRPVLVLYGELDERDNVPVEESVRRLEHAFRAGGKRDYRIVVIPRAGHGFLDEQRQSLMPEFVETLTSWIKARSGD